MSSAVLRDGRSIPCELVVAGIGVQPAIDMLANSGLDVEDGVMVNEYLETNQARSSSSELAEEIKLRRQACIPSEPITNGVGLRREL